MLILSIVYHVLQHVLACACVHACVHLHKAAEQSRELSKGGCPGFLGKKDEGCVGDATWLTGVKRKEEESRKKNKNNKIPEPVKIHD